MMLPFLLETPAGNSVWILIAVCGATVLYAIFRPSARSKRDPLARSPSSARLSQQRNTERQMESLLVELSEMARQISAQLDTRSQKLELLIQEADEKIAALERARAGGATSSSSSTSTTRDDREAWTMQAEPAPPEPEADAIDPRHQQVYELADQGAAAPEIARQLDRPRGEIELILALRPRTRT
jgi:leucyl aminopeptidase (aminopeptidase T)